MILRPPRTTRFPYSALFRSRIAITTANPLEVDVDPECVRGMHQAAELLSSLGHDVEEAAPLMPGKDGLRLLDRKSTRLNSSHANISYAVSCLTQKNFQKHMH